MAQNQHAGYASVPGNHGVLSWQKLTTYVGSTVPPHTFTAKNSTSTLKQKWYEHEPQTVTILWDMPIQTDHEIKANRPDIVIENKKKTKLPTH